MRIKIEAGLSDNGRVTLASGELLEHITHCDISLNAIKGPVATLRFIVPDISVHAQATVSEEHLRELAAAHGYALVRQEELRESTVLEPSSKWPFPTGRQS